MFSPVLGRVIRSTCTISGVASVCTASRLAAITTLGAKQSLSRRPQHQRRLSSSKASIPPNDSSNDANPEESLPETKRSTAKAAEKVGESKTAKSGGKVAKAAKTKSAPTPRNIPHVPALDYLKPADALHANFYSLHRPMSITDTLPMPRSDEFDAIFEKQKPNTVFYSGIDAVDDALSKLDIDRVQQELNRIPPFHPPPAPARRNITDLSTNAQQYAPSLKSWSTNVVFTQTTHASGKRTLSVSAAPMVECPSPAGDMTGHFEAEHRPFLTRMMHRERAMQLISVKRQRKLKMKKHKYKKLMKRTRLLRRKLDRT